MDRTTREVVLAVYYGSDNAYPPAMLMAKESVVPFEVVNEGHTTYDLYWPPDPGVPDPLKAPGTGSASWRLRQRWVQRGRVDEPGPTDGSKWYREHPDVEPVHVLEIEYFESLPSTYALSTSVVREVWVLQPGVGLIEIRGLGVNGPPGIALTDPRFLSEPTFDPQYITRRVV
jgi:hypothetical protein